MTTRAKNVYIRKLNKARIAPMMANFPTRVDVSIFLGLV